MVALLSDGLRDCDQSATADRCSSAESTVDGHEPLHTHILKGQRHRLGDGGADRRLPRRDPLYVKDQSGSSAVASRWWWKSGERGLGHGCYAAAVTDGWVISLSGCW
jgi:hypothetical protein